MTIQLCRTIALAALLALPSVAKAQSAPSTTYSEEQSDRNSSVRRTPAEIREAAAALAAKEESACNECLWNYAEHYNFTAANPPPGVWVNYAADCCEVCRHPEAIQAINATVATLNEITLCLYQVLRHT